MGKESFLATVEAQASGLLLFVQLILRPFQVSYFYELPVGLIQLVGALVSVGSGAVKIHGDCGVVHVPGGVGQGLLSYWQFWKNWLVAYPPSMSALNICSILVTLITMSLYCW